MTLATKTMRQHHGSVDNGPERRYTLALLDENGAQVETWSYEAVAMSSSDEDGATDWIEINGDAPSTEDVHEAIERDYRENV